MKLTSLSVALVVALGAASGNAYAQQGPVLQLDTTGDSQSDCEFLTENGVSISGTNPGQISASGSFIGGNCGGSGSPSTATVDLTVLPTVINVGDTAQINWSGTGDVCRDNGSVLPAAVPGWPATGDACIGAHECATGASITPTFQFSGTYTFKLKCIVGANSQQPQRDTAEAFATVQVNGDTSPPTTNCVAPQGLTRLTTGQIALPSTGQQQDGVDLTKWGTTFGWGFANPGDYYYSWPGLANNSIHFYLNQNSYIALQFTVPSDYPYYDPASETGPSGTLFTNDSWATPGDWSVTITEDCGDFIPPQFGARDYYCYAGFQHDQGGLTYEALPLSVTPPFFNCPLERGHTYYLNITPAPIGQPTNQIDCPGTYCQFNLSNGGAIEGTYEQLP